jgi:stearoyl-CoA desaturase (delta-9 desaturase)
MSTHASATWIIAFLLAHWWASLLMQTFFLHRYASHGMFTFKKGWERFFYLLTYVFQGSSFLVPSAYAWLHRAHHAYADTEKDPHSPHTAGNVFAMMWQTKQTYSPLAHGKKSPEARFAGYTPQWPALDKLGSNYAGRVLWGVAYTLFYVAFAPHWAFFLLLPAHFLMGPIQGALVNWAGHKYGYRNFDTRDMSRNVEPWGFVGLGELFQNNHHRRPQSANFAARAFELDPVYPFILLLRRMGILELEHAPSATHSVPHETALIAAE